MTQEKIIEAIQAASMQNKLGCEKAHELADTLHVSLHEIGKICNELKIKIKDCELGCF